MAQGCARCPPSRSWRSPLYSVTSVDGEVAGVWAAAAPLGMHSGKVVRHPSGTGGVDAAAVSQAGSNALSRLPGPSTTTCGHSRRVFTRSDRNEPPHQAPCPCTLYACDGIVMGLGTSGRRGPRAHGRSRAPRGARANGASGPLGASGLSLSCGLHRPRGVESPGRAGAQVLRRASGRAIGAQGHRSVGSRQGCGRRAERSV